MEEEKSGKSMAALAHGESFPLHSDVGQLLRVQ